MTWILHRLIVALAIVTMLGGQPNVVPFELVAEHLIVVRGTIGAARDLAFVVDTGTTRTVVDAGLAARLASSHGTDTLRSFGREIATDTAVLPSLTLGPIVRSNLPVLVADLQSQRQQLGLAPDALVGLDVLASGCLTIDYRERRLTFGCGGHWAGRMPFVPGVPAVEAVVDGTAYRLMIDSGSQLSVLFESAIPPGAAIRPEGEVSASHLAGTVRMKWFTPRSVRLGKDSLGRPPIFIMPGADARYGYDGLLDPRWIPGDEVHLDFERRLLAWR
jgi:hypothetical protein